MKQKKDPVKVDKRLTGASNIDEQLQEILDLVFRDYVQTWYSKISNDPSFPTELRKVFNVVITNFASRFVTALGPKLRFKRSLFSKVSLIGLLPGTATISFL